MRFAEFKQPGASRNVAMESIIKDLGQLAESTGAITTFRTLNESTGSKGVVIHLDEAGIKDFLEKGKEMLLAPLQKGAIKADELKDKITKGLSKEQSSKAMQVAKKFAKPALAFLLIGGGMLAGADPAMANELANQAFSGPGAELLNYMIDMGAQQGIDTDLLVNSINNATIDGQSAGEYAAKMMQAAQGQEDAQTFYDQAIKTIMQAANQGREGLEGVANLGQELSQMDNKDFINRMHEIVTQGEIKGVQQSWQAMGGQVNADQALQVGQKITGNQTTAFIDHLQDIAAKSPETAAKEYAKWVSAGLKADFAG